MKVIYVVAVVSMAAGLVVVSPSSAFASDEVITGREMMSVQERSEHRQEMRSKDAGEREEYRKEHHEQMKERAQEQGKVIPDEPGVGGRGMSNGQGGHMGGAGRGR